MNWYRNPLLTAAHLATGAVLHVWPVLGFEWVSPDCGILTEGPIYAYWGFPFPAYQFTGASSGVYRVAPIFLFLNLVFQSAILGVLLFLLTSRLKRGRLLLASTGACLLLIGTVNLIGFFSWGPSTAQVLPTASSRQYSYFDLRPVGPRTSFRDDCTPSDFWYPHPPPPPPPELASLKCHSSFSTWRLREAGRGNAATARTATLVPLGSSIAGGQGCVPGLVELVLRDLEGNKERFELEARYYFAAGIGLYLRRDMANHPNKLPRPTARIYLGKDYLQLEYFVLEQGSKSIRAGRFECEQDEECSLERME